MVSYVCKKEEEVRKHTYTCTYTCLLFQNLRKKGEPEGNKVGYPLTRVGGEAEKEMTFV